jgi:hypothetical protein
MHHVEEIQSMNINYYRSLQTRGTCIRLVTRPVFYGEELLALLLTPKLKDHPLSAVRDSLFDIFAATHHIGGRSSIRNMRMRHAAVTGNHSTPPTPTPTPHHHSLCEIQHKYVRQ